MLLAVAFAMTLLANPRRGHSDGGRVGLGLVIGQPTGGSAQLELGGPGLGTAINLAAGLDLFGDFEVYAHLDYIVLLAALMREPAFSLPVYLGVGVFAVAAADAEVGIRAPLGLQLELTAAPVHAFVEIAAELKIIDGPDLGLGGAIGARYFF